MSQTIRSRFPSDCSDTMTNQRTVLPAIIGLTLIMVSSTLRPPLSADSEVLEGQSTTLLSDGSWLLLGGNGRQGLVDREVPRGPESMSSPSPAQPLRLPRAWHTATMLSSGKVLVVGGLDGSRRVVASPEMLD